MREISFEGCCAKWSRFLIHALIISLALNLGLLATFMTLILKEKKSETLLLQAKSSLLLPQQVRPISCSNAEILEKYETASFASLVLELENEKLVEEGYYMRDLALACLVAYHHFDLQRALSGKEIQTRPFSYSNFEKIIELIPGLDREWFQVISHFAQTELWPLTAQGLFNKMKEQRTAIPQSLQEAFFLSKEFYQIERAFSRFPFIFTRDTLLQLLLDGNWEIIKQVIQTIELHPKGNIEQVGAFLAKFANSKLAAYLLIALDPNYPYVQFRNEQLEQLISLLDQHTVEAEIFLTRVSTSARSAGIRQLAVDRIAAWQGKDSYLFQEYQVERGDSLWTLSRQFNISIESIRALNALESDRLNPGQILRIPNAGVCSQDNNKIPK